jgi:hypothetical protein
MTVGNSLVNFLSALCEKEGGIDVVAQKIGANKTYLWQIVNGTPMKSGKPRGIGRDLREKLDAAYPGWAATHYELVGEPGEYKRDLTSSARELGKLYDLIPEQDLIKRGRAYTAAAAAILDVLQVK